MDLKNMLIEIKYSLERHKKGFEQTEERSVDLETCQLR